MKRLLVTGGAGYLGAYLAPLAARRGWEVCATIFSRPAAGGVRTRRVDLTEARAVTAAFSAERPDAVIHTACSNRTPANIAAIAPAARHVAAAAREHEARLVHVSTDLVFDGESAPYADDAPLSPIMPYGAAKAEAEAAVAELCPAAAVARPSLIWALDPLDHQTAWLVAGARSGEPITLFTDEIRCPVHLGDLAEALLELAARPEVSGPLNLVGAQALSRWELGLRLLRALNLPRGPSVTPGLTTGSGLVRARNLTLHARRAERELRTRLRGVDEVLEAVGGRLRRAPICEG